MRRGRPEKPRALKELAGNPGKRKPKAQLSPSPPPPDPPPAPKDTKPQPPTWLPPDAQAIWREEYPYSSSLYLKDSDLQTFATYCAAVWRYRVAFAVLTAQGQTYTTSTGYVRSRPEVKIVEAAERIILSFQAALALHPMARLRAGSIQAAGQGELPLQPPAQPQPKPGPDAASPDHHDPVSFLH